MYHNGLAISMRAVGGSDSEYGCGARGVECGESSLARSVILIEYLWRRWRILLGLIWRELVNLRRLCIQSGLIYGLSDLLVERCSP